MHRPVRLLTVLAVAAVAAASGRATAGGPKVLVSQVSVEGSVSAGEAWAVTNPKRPNQVAVIWLGTTGDAAHPEAMFAGYCGVARSTNGGRTWTRSRLPLATSTTGGTTPEAEPAGRLLPICGDPMVGVEPDGLLFGAGIQLGSPSWMQGVTSSDFGAHWSEPVEVFGANTTATGTTGRLGQDKSVAIGEGRGFMAVDPITGEISIHAQEDGGAEGRWLTTSTDRGKTWSTPRPIDPELQSTSAGAQSSAGGTIAVSYVVDPTSASYASSPSPAVRCAPACTVFATSRDHGVTWTRHVIKAAGAAGPSVGPGRSSVVAADPSSLGRFAVLLSVGDAERQLWVTSDQGVSWRKVETLRAFEGDSILKPWIAYAPSGALGVVWRLRHANGRTDVLAEVSPDGGARFSTPVRLAVGLPPEQQVTPGDDCACNLHLDRATLSATWSDSRTGQRQIYFGRFDYRNLPLQSTAAGRR